MRLTIISSPQTSQCFFSEGYCKTSTALLQPTLTRAPSPHLDDEDEELEEDEPEEERQGQWSEEDEEQDAQVKLSQSQGESETKRELIGQSFLPMF